MYNYTLDFSQGEDQRLKIITGPNGYGKTTVLQLIYALLGKDWTRFYHIPFSYVLFYFDDFIIKVVQNRTVFPMDEESDLPGDEEVSLQFELMNAKQDKGLEEPVRVDENREIRIEGQLELVLNSMKCFYLTDKRILLRNKEQDKHVLDADTDSAMSRVTNKIAEIKAKGDNEGGVNFFCELVSFFKFADKEMIVDDRFGIRFRINNVSKTIIPVTSLSSGEKHVLLQLFELVFDGKAGDLVMIDEPELSFHPAWLNVYVSVLQKIQNFKLVEGREMQIILATHSPLLVGARWDDTMDLYNLRKNG